MSKVEKWKSGKPWYKIKKTPLTCTLLNEKYYLCTHKTKNINMITGNIIYQVDVVGKIFWEGDIFNCIDAQEQNTDLFFIKMFDSIVFSA